MARGNRERVVFRAFRGTPRSSVYRDHAVSTEAFDRIRALGLERGLAVLDLEPGVTTELDKREARELARAVDALRRSAELLDLDGDLAPIGEVARWCARSTGRAWLSCTSE